MSTAPFGDDYLKVTLVKRGSAWAIAEVTELDSGLKMIAENLQPAVTEIRDRRSGKSAGPSTPSDFARVVIAIERSYKDGLTLVEKLLKDNPKSQGLRYLRSLCLAASDRDAEAATIWAELVGGDSPVVPALRKLAEHYSGSRDEAEKKQALQLYQRYLAFEPDDPRAHTGLAALYEAAGNLAAAESEFHAAIADDQTGAEVYLDLAQFCAEHNRLLEVALVLRDAEQHAIEPGDLFANLLSRYWFSDNADVPEALAASQPQRMAQSYGANLNLARIRIDNDHPREALPLLKKAVALNSKSSDPYDWMAEAYRKLREWPAALTAADTAIRLDGEDADAYFHRACVLARLGRRVEALTALKRAIELDEGYEDLLTDEADLKSLATLPEFKKLLPRSEKPNRAP
jgi:tetratricopeptide (TPR) repeat protein